MTTTNTFELNTIFDRRKSFYGKAKIRRETNGDITLISYTTEVSKYIKSENKVVDLGKWSATTTRHQQEFRKQIENGYL